MSFTLRAGESPATRNGVSRTAEPGYVRRVDLRTLLPRSTDTVTLRALEHRDAAAYAAGTADPQVRRFAHLPEPSYTPERVRELIDTVIDDGLRSGTLGVLAVAAAVDDGFLGSLVVYDVTPSSAEVGFWLAPEGRGRGAAAASLRLARSMAGDAGLTRLRARTMVDNLASVRVLEAAGFRPQGAPVSDTTPSGRTALVQEFAVGV